MSVPVQTQPAESAIVQAARLYARHGLALGKDLENYARAGYLFATPDRLLLARPINLDRGLDEWLPPGEGNAWYVRLAVGRGCLDWFLEQAPHRKPYIAWSRGFRPCRAAELKIFDTATLERRIKSWARPE